MNSPRFKKPPVVEVAISCQFADLSALQTPHIGLLWSKYKAKFPKIEQHPPIAPSYETFDEPKAEHVTVRFDFMGIQPTRTWFVSNGGDQLIQIQSSRFIHNWRRTAEHAAYPSYSTLLDSFREEITLFEGFIKEEDLGEISYDQCEVTYVNHLEAGQGWRTYGDLPNVLTVWSGLYSSEFLSQPEDVNMAFRYVINDSAHQPMGRLHVQLTPSIRASDKAMIYALTLTARCRPLGPSLLDAISALDLSHQWVVNGFDAITSHAMHRVWEKENGD